MRDFIKNFANKANFMSPKSYIYVFCKSRKIKLRYFDVQHILWKVITTYLNLELLSLLYCMSMLSFWNSAVVAIVVVAAVSVLVILCWLKLLLLLRFHYCSHWSSHKSFQNSIMYRKWTSKEINNYKQYLENILYCFRYQIIQEFHFQLQLWNAMHELNLWGNIQWQFLTRGCILQVGIGT